MKTGRPRNRPEDVWRYVEKGEPTDCWPWTGATRRRGYGTFTVNRRHMVAHRVVFFATTGTDPDGFLVCHTCDNPSCCNPAHLFLGSPVDNVHDMIRKGRANPPKGEAHHAAKLTSWQVSEIRRRRAEGEKLVILAREFGVTDSLLSGITEHPDKKWRHV